MPQSPHPPPSIAIIDNDPRLLASLSELFESSGFSVLTFSSGQEFVNADGLKQVDGIVADIGMPGLNGFELKEIVERLRPEVPMILMTGRYELIERLGTDGLQRHTIFTKPFDGWKLVATLSEAVRRN